ncbi:condensin subunit ScpA [Sphingobacterium allocomposti]|jgi:segregation and condensation protein A|uniref:Segregation and condensation protein A n=1 Tax=Sphingobacterium allocomposti TaxID=415956 RepID=A0A5S5CZ35_9SPHI|nr:segregation/condensation protein A [Sphingobacterium composti Yoo et al. 2007 non Ten et al. 2007]TYP88815.1 condensin subunit ScpA [Sphingobacterium composti Yoo et al. 2007 non Ten et al. 2007]HLS96649.1 segregation/condensation protein A [Sphingobacterium sp.]
MQSEAYEIKLEQFEGPFDLLLFFIERDELNIHDIPISKITDDFLDYIQQMQSLNIELASEFIFVASTLMRIKAKMLLPRPELDEAENEIDLKKELTQKLILYKQFKEVCEKLRELEDARGRLHSRGNVTKDNRIARKKDNTEEQLDTFDLYRLLVVYEKLMFNFRHRIQEVTHTVVKYPYTIEQQKKAIAELIEINSKLDFQQMRAHSENKVQFVYNFLAMLEMLQQKLLEIQIGLGFNNFWIEKRSDLN